MQREEPLIAEAFTPVPVLVPEYRASVQHRAGREGRPGDEMSGFDPPSASGPAGPGSKTRESMTALAAISQPLGGVPPENSTKQAGTPLNDSPNVSGSTMTNIDPALYVDGEAASRLPPNAAAAQISTPPTAPNAPYANLKAGASQSRFELTSTAMTSPNAGVDDGTRRKNWTDEEHERFKHALELYGRNWKMVEAHVGSRTAKQIRSHAQKYFLRLMREQSADRHNIPPARKWKSRKAARGNGDDATAAAATRPGVDTAAPHAQTASSKDAINASANARGKAANMRPNARGGDSSDCSGSTNNSDNNVSSAANVKPSVVEFGGARESASAAARHTAMHAAAGRCNGGAMDDELKRNKAERKMAEASDSPQSSSVATAAATEPRVLDGVADALTGGKATPDLSTSEHRRLHVGGDLQYPPSESSFGFSPLTTYMSPNMCCSHISGVCGGAAATRGNSGGVTPTLRPPHNHVAEYSLSPHERYDACRNYPAYMYSPSPHTPHAMHAGLHGGAPPAAMGGIGGGEASKAAAPAECGGMALECGCHKGYKRPAIWCCEHEMNMSPCMSSPLAAQMMDPSFSPHHVQGYAHAMPLSSPALPGVGGSPLPNLAAAGAVAAGRAPIPQRSGETLYMFEMYRRQLGLPPGRYYAPPSASVLPSASSLTPPPLDAPLTPPPVAAAGKPPMLYSMSTGGGGGAAKAHADRSGGAVVLDGGNIRPPGDGPHAMAHMHGYHHHAHIQPQAFGGAATTVAVADGDRTKFVEPPARALLGGAARAAPAGAEVSRGAPLVPPTYPGGDGQQLSLLINAVDHLEKGDAGRVVGNKAPSAGGITANFEAPPPAKRRNLKATAAAMAVLVNGGTAV